MKIMFDTNILISAALFPSDKINSFIEFIVARHELILPDVVTNEFIEVAAYDRFNKVKDAKKFLDRLSYTEYKTPPIEAVVGLSIRDDEDYEILFAAVRSGVDIFITGDKDFLECGVSQPKMMPMAQFAFEYMHE